MTVPDRYSAAAQAWAGGATAVYGPIARRLVALAPEPLRGRTVLDAGAGTGVVSEALLEAGASPVAADLSHGMLSWRREQRPPAVVADVGRLPLCDAAVDGTIAAFVLNHLEHPVEGLRELARVTRPHGVLLATVYSNASRSAVRDTVDEVARSHGWDTPGWYVRMKEELAPLLGTVDRMARAAADAGLGDVEVLEEAVDVGVSDARRLVDYRFGQAQFTEWISGLSPGEDDAVRGAAVRAAGPIMEPYRPIVVFLRSRAV